MLVDIRYIYWGLYIYIYIKLIPSILYFYVCYNILFDSFQHLHPADNSTNKIYDVSVHSLLDFAIKGFNTCLLICGESGSGKSTLATGENFNKPGIIPLLIERLFNEIREGVYLLSFDYYKTKN